VAPGVTYGPVAYGDEPLTADAVREQCRAGCELDGATADALGRAARELAERHAGRLFAPRTATVTLPAFPRSEPLRLPVEPVRAVSAVRYRATDGTLTTLDPAAYQAALTFSPPLLAPAAGGYWPDTQSGSLAAVEVDLAVGPLRVAVPEAAKQAMLLAAAYWQAHRGDGGDPERAGLPPAAVRLLNLLDTGGYR
jgi:uncharacterized phiE125 gp8 family phage protein